MVKYHIIIYNESIENFRVAVSKGITYDTVTDGYSKKFLCLPFGKEIVSFDIKAILFGLLFCLNLYISL